MSFTGEINSKRLNQHQFSKIAGGTTPGTAALIAGGPLDSLRVELVTTFITRESSAPPPSLSLKPREDSQQSTLE